MHIEVVPGLSWWRGALVMMIADVIMGFVLAKIGVPDWLFYLVGVVVISVLVPYCLGMRVRRG